LLARFGICRIVLGWHDVSPVTLHSYRGYNPVVELLTKIGRIIPKNVVVLAYVEMHVSAGPVAATGPDNWPGEPERVASLKIHPCTCPRYISDHEPRLLYVRNNPCVDLLIVSRIIGETRIKPRTLYSRLKRGFPNGDHIVTKAHCDERNL
jgi:hypothetical protein